MTTMKASPPTDRRSVIAALRDVRGSGVLHATILVVALALGSIAAVKALTSTVGARSACAGEAVAGMVPLAGGCAEASADPGGAPVATPVSFEGAAVASPQPERRPLPEPAPDPEPQDEGGGGNPVTDFIGGFIGGDFTDCSSIACAGGQIVSGLIPVVGDGRDTIAGGIRCFSGEGCGDLVWAGVGWIPVLGDVAKGTRKVNRVLEAADTVGDVVRRAPPGGVLEDAARKAGDIRVIGRRGDTEVAEDWPDHNVLNDPDWTIAKNDEWISDGVRNKENFYMASPEDGNLVQTSGPFEGQPTVYARELAQLEEAGYVRIGDYMVHPDNVGDFPPP
jgi:hypothetical protein